MFDALAKQYLSSLKSNGSGYADQPNARWHTIANDGDSFYRSLATAGGKGNIVDWSKLGYDGQLPGIGGASRDDSGEVTGYTPGAVPDEFRQFIDQNNFGRIQGLNDENFVLDQLTKDGQPIAGASMSTSQPNNDGFNIVRAIVNTGLIAGAGAGAYGAYGGGGGAAVGGSAGLSSADLAAIYGAEGYGTTGAAAGGLAAEGGAAGAAGAGFAGSAPAYGGVGTAGAGAGTDAVVGGSSAAGAAGAGGGGAAGSGSGFLNSLASGNWSGAASAAGDYLTSSSGLGTAAQLVSGLLQSSAAKKAAQAQIDSATNANQLLSGIYQQTRQDNLPALAARNAGLAGYGALLSNPSSVQNDPGYAFGRDQGVQSIDRTAAGKGGLYSGATLKSQARFNNDYATTKYDNALGRYGNLAQLGSTGTQTIANSANNYGQSAANNITGAGNAAASGTVGSANAWGNALSGAYNGYMQNNLINSLIKKNGG